MATLPRDRAGMTLVEIMIAMVCGVVVIGATMNLTMHSFRGAESSALREDIYRTARFLGMSLERDLASTGVAIKSHARFGTLMVKGDTLVTISVPYDSITTAPFTALTPTYSMPTSTVPPGSNGTGNCGTLCVWVQGSATDTVNFGVGDMVQMTVDNERRFINITEKRPLASNVYQFVFSSADTLMLHPADWTRPDPTATPILLRPAETSFQRITPVMYYRDGTRLMRSTRLDAINGPVGDIVAENISAFTANLVFADGDVAAAADPSDGDDTNDYDDLAAVVVRATIQASRDERGVRPEQTFEWRFAPRNLAYERNR